MPNRLGMPLHERAGLGECVEARGQNDKTMGYF